MESASAIQTGVLRQLSVQQVGARVRMLSCVPERRTRTSGTVCQPMGRGLPGSFGRGDGAHAASSSAAPRAPPQVVSCGSSSSGGGCSGDKVSQGFKFAIQYGGLTAQVRCRAHSSYLGAHSSPHAMRPRFVPASHHLPTVLAPPQSAYPYQGVASACEEVDWKVVQVGGAQWRRVRSQ